MGRPISDVGKFVRDRLQTTGTTNAEIATAVVAHFTYRTFDVAKLRQFIARIRSQQKRITQVIG